MMTFLQPAALKKAFNVSLALAVIGLVNCSFVAYGAEQAEDLEDLLDHFEENTALLPQASSTTSPLEEYFSGYTKLFVAGNTTHFCPEPDKSDWQGLSSFRIETMLEVNYQLGDWKIFGSVRGYHDLAYTIEGRYNFTSEVLESYEQDLEFRELYQGSLTDNIDLKIGRQIVVWGRSDNFRVTDILNPLDNRDLGITDIENIRLPLTMIKLDAFIGDWNLDLLAIQEHRYDENPVYGHYFYPANALTYVEKTPAGTIENCEIGMELYRSFKGWDISFYAARLYNDEGTYISTDPMIMEHEKITMMGASMGFAKGDILYIGELAYFKGLQFMASDQDYSRTDILVGIEYSGWTETTISFDYVRRRLHHYDSVLDTSPEKPQETENEIALRISRDCLHNRLELTALVLLSGTHGQDGATQRFTAKYNIVDNWSATAGMLLYQPGEGPLSTNGDTGRIFFEIRYDF